MKVINPKGIMKDIPEDMWPSLKDQGYLLPAEQEQNVINISGMPKDGPVISVIVLTWNRMDLTIKCIESIFEHTKVPFELIVVDNASTDGTVEYLTELEKTRSNMHVVFNEKNRGVAGGRNDGIRIARAPFLAFFDNDSTVGACWDEIMLKTLNLEPSVGFVGRNGTFYYDLTHRGMCGIELMDENPVRVDVVSGGATLIRKAVFDQVGLLDEWGMGEFWHEDSEICLRASLAGWKSLAVKYPWEHKAHSTYRDEMGDKWMDSFNKNLEYIRQKLKNTNVLRIKINPDPEDQHVSHMVRLLVDNLRTSGKVVIEEPFETIIPMSLRRSTYFVAESKGKKYICLEQRNTIAPKNWLDALDGYEVITVSEFSKENLERSGIKVKAVMPITFDADVFNPDIDPTVQFSESFLFFVDDTGPASGINMILEAYFREFSSSDEVVLYVRGRRENSEITAMIDGLRNVSTNPPQLIYFNEQWSDGKLAKYYRRCGENGVLLAPYHASAAPFSIAQALACGSRVISTRYGAIKELEDIADSQLYLLDTMLVPSRHQNNSMSPFYDQMENPEWGLFDIGELMAMMRKVHDSKIQARKPKTVAKAIIKAFDIKKPLQIINKFYG